MTETPPDPLRELARSYGVQLEYQAMDGKPRPASAGSLIGVLRALGAELDSEADASRALRDRHRQIWRRRIEPVVVAWDGEANRSTVRLPASLARSGLKCRLTT